MKYYATIYIDEFLEYEILVSLYNGNGLDFTHAFLGLTKGKSPDELDKADETLRQEYLKNKEFKLIKILSRLVIIKQFIYIRSKFANSYLF
ncbi:hypothetical protein RFR77_001870 [Campylobacter jejuni]|uniref:hypothetical protein n=1 Tax=Campylobacter jejuni TaxID=197 RepID=UPI000B2A9B85|nr:hypothetical protein [Campylobacter jejuni]EIT5293383.1 hypothetical protein [Campylobacter coli]EHQ5926200.1 hypothetical protein [Campylobacter jejuni]EJF0781174.1 hypothetical protein [Campylobacter jejuni]EJN5214227.1 hypothetical protein [Campylobacter jejuni]EJS9933090.1 hypothetical protein [Campylobacter jejuni]